MTDAEIARHHFRLAQQHLEAAQRLSLAAASQSAHPSPSVPPTTFDERNVIDSRQSPVDYVELSSENDDSARVDRSLPTSTTSSSGPQHPRILRRPHTAPSSASGMTPVESASALAPALYGSGLPPRELRRLESSSTSSASSYSAPAPPSISRRTGEELARNTEDDAASDFHDDQSTFSHVTYATLPPYEDARSSPPPFPISYGTHTHSDSCPQHQLQQTHLRTQASSRPMDSISSRSSAHSRRRPRTTSSTASALDPAIIPLPRPFCRPQSYFIGPNGQPVPVYASAFPVAASPAYYPQPPPLQAVPRAPLAIHSQPLEFNHTLPDSPSTLRTAVPPTFRPASDSPFVHLLPPRVRLPPAPDPLGPRRGVCHPALPLVAAPPVGGLARLRPLGHHDVVDLCDGAQVPRHAAPREDDEPTRAVRESRAGRCRAGTGRADEGAAAGRGEEEERAGEREERAGRGGGGGEKEEDAGDEAGERRRREKQDKAVQQSLSMLV
ncbi:hypothetical protein JCM21900_002179 [Sporobolomyces salmonicolor]